MKHKTTILILMSFFLLHSCQDNLIPELSESQKLVLFTYIKPNEIIVASITKSIPALENNRQLALIDSALVTLYENNLLIDTLEQLDSTLFFSHIKTIPNNKYRLKVTDLSKKCIDISSEEVLLLEPSQINNLKIDSIGKYIGKQDKLKITVSFDKIKGYNYIAYTTKPYEIHGRKGNRWETIQQYMCSEDEIVSVEDVSLAYIGCLKEINQIEFESGNHNLQKLDSITVKLCKLPNDTGDFLKTSLLATGGTIGGLLAPDDNISFNIKDGYGAVLSISCEEKTLHLK